MRLRLVAAAAAVMAFAATPASASPVLVVKDDRVERRDDPFLTAGADLPPAPRGQAVTPPARTSATTVKQALARAFERKQISKPDYDRYRAIYSKARTTRAGLAGTRRTQLGSVLTTLGKIAARGQLTASRMPALFLQLQRNTEYWPRRPIPASGARIVFEGDPLIFQHYPGHGLQIQPLANFGKANALWRNCAEQDLRPAAACDAGALRALLDSLARIASRRSGFTTWEYWFPFGGGTPPWTSGLAQGTAIQSMARGSRYLDEPRYLSLARAGLGAFEKRPPAGVRQTVGRGAHYLLYSFAPGLRVLNAFAHAVTGLYDYAEIAGEERARKLFRSGDAALRRELPRYDTGAWSLYSLGGAEATLEYHELATGFLQNLCTRTARAAYCDTHDRFERYLTDPPAIRYLGAARSQVGRRTVLRFRLSKRSSVTVRIKLGDRLVYANGAALPRGTHAFVWTPRSSGSHRYRFAAESFKGTKGDARGHISVAARSR